MNSAAKNKLLSTRSRLQAVQYSLKSRLQTKAAVIHVESGLAIYCPSQKTPAYFTHHK